jgi:hypothetical protein
MCYSGDNVILNHEISFVSAFCTAEPPTQPS